MTPSAEKPLLAVTLGDPAGVGPETIVGAWADERVHACCRAFVVGHAEILRCAVRLLRSHVEVVEIASPDEAPQDTLAIGCLPSGSSDVLDLPPCSVDARGGQAAYDALLVAARLAQNGQVSGIVTAPLCKAALWKAGHRYPGHTELLAELCEVSDFAMMLYLAPDAAAGRPIGLGVVHVTLHTALRDVFAGLSPDAILAKARLVHGAMIALGVPQPRIGVCALNPHAGEDGLFGDEEQTTIGPAVHRGLTEGLNLTGPMPTDTLMVRAKNGEFDAVVAMYHDQGHIALKLLGIHRAVNITLGLPIVRTSVAHGTAFDLAWQGRAESTGMVEAICVASRLALQRGMLRD